MLVLAQPKCSFLLLWVTDSSSSFYIMFNLQKEESTKQIDTAVKFMLLSNVGIN